MVRARERSRRSRAAIAGLVVALTAAPALAAPPGPAPPAAPRPSPILHLPAPRSAPATPRVDPSTLLVRLRSAREAGEVAGAHGVTLGATVPGTGYRLVRTSPGRLGHLRAELDRDPRVAAVEPNHIRSIASEPSDPFFRKSQAQSYLRNLRAPAAWSLQRAGAGAVVAVLDTGVDARHGDLGRRVLPGIDVVDGDDDPEDGNGHGTMVAGAAAAITHNGRGIAGLAWGASVLPVRVLDRAGHGTDADVATGITWAADHGADVINVSASGPGASGALAEAVAYATGRGALVVAAAGNSSDDERAQYPAAIDAVLAVGATKQDGDLAYFSSTGPWVDLVAPGEEILSTYRTDDPDGPAVPYAVGDGTSFAAPLAAAAALLVRARHPDWSPAAIAAQLRATAADRGPPGRDEFYGAGGLDVAAALGAPAAPVVAPPPRDAGGPDDVPARARRLPLGEIGRDGVLSPEGDVDFHAIDLPAPGWYAASVSESIQEDPDHPSGALDVRLEVLDPGLRPIVRSDDEGLESEVEYAAFYARRAGRHYLRVGGVNGVRPGYSVRAYPTSPAQADARFEEGRRFREVDDADGAAIADVTGDGRPDAITGTRAGLSVHPQDVDGWLRTVGPLPAHSAPHDVTTGDLDGDGDADVLATGHAGIDVYLQGAGGLGAPRLLARAALTQADVADLDGDGRAEIVAAGDTGIVRYTRTATGWTAARLTTTRAIELEIGDVTGDGLADLVTSEGGISVRRQLADHRFAAPVRYRAATTSLGCCEGIEVADVTGDRRKDVIATQGGNGDQSVEVLAQTTVGTLGYPTAYGTSYIPEGVEAADINRDGRLDVVVVHPSWEDVGVYLQTSSGRLGPEHRYSLPGGNATLRSLAIGDVSSDGAPDLLVADDWQGLILFRQRTEGWPTGRATWVRSSTPAALATHVDPAGPLSLTLGRALDPASATPQSVRLSDASSGRAIATTAAYAADTRRLTIRPAETLPGGRPYTLVLDGLRDTASHEMADPYELRFTAGAPVPDRTPPDTRIVAGPARRTTRYPIFSSVASQPHSRFECSIDDSRWRRCRRAWMPGWPADDPGVHTARIRAIDAAGHADPAPATRTYRHVEPGPSPDNDRPYSATPIAGTTGSARASTLDADKAPRFEPSPADNPGGAAVWWRWTAPASQTAVFSTAGSDFDTVLGVYEWPAEDKPLVRVADNDDAGGRSTSRVSFAAVAGRTYWIQVDGFHGAAYGDEADAGDARLTWNATEPPPTARLVTGAAGALTATAATLNGTADPGGAAGSFRFEYGTTTAYGTRTPAVDGHSGAFARSISQRITGLAPARTYHYRLLFTSPSGVTVAGEDRTFRTLTAAPAVSTLAPASVRAGSAALRGTIPQSDAWVNGYIGFDFGRTTAYGRRTGPDDPFEYWGGVLTTTVHGLAGGTTYHYRAVGRTETGEVVPGADRTFTTPPAGAPAIDPPSGPSAGHDHAEQDVDLDPNGAPTTAWVEYGPTTAYGSRGPVFDAGLGSARRTVTLRVAGLRPHTTYHYRVVAANAAGTTRTPDATFTTEPPPPVVTPAATTAVSTTAATVSARIDPGGSPTSYGFDVWRWPPTHTLDPYPDTDLPAATGVQTASVRLTQLDPDTEYAVQVVARNGSGTARPPVYRFRTARGAPLVAPSWTGWTRGVFWTDAHLHGMVNPAGPLTRWYFEWGIARVDEHRTPTVTAGAGSLEINAPVHLEGLQPATTYRFRLVAINSLGTTRGPTETFTTLAETATAADR